MIGGEVAQALWDRACVGREGYCSSDLQDAAKWAISEAFRMAEEAARSATLPSNYQWSEGNREKFDFGRDSAANAIRAFTPTPPAAASEVVREALENAQRDMGHILAVLLGLRGAKKATDLLHAAIDRARSALDSAEVKS